MKLTFTILITTKNRRVDLAITLDRIKYILDRNDVSCIICDDGSIDGTATFIATKYSKIKLIQNDTSQGLIYSRNRLMELVTTDFAISLDDDLNFITKNPLEIIEDYFSKNSKTAVLSFRIYWNKLEPETTISNELSEQIQSFAGGAHVWRMAAWRTIPNYPEWFIFYGEENFVSYHLFKKNWKIYYLPQVLVHHRVDVKARRKDSDYAIRLRRSLRSGWYLFLMFYPLQTIPKKMAYSLWMQFKLKVFKGDLKALQALFLALLDLVWNLPKILKNSNRLTQEEYDAFNNLAETKLYWQPKNNLVSMDHYKNNSSRRRI